MKFEISWLFQIPFFWDKNPMLFFRDELYVSDSWVVVIISLMHNSLMILPSIARYLDFVNQRAWRYSWEDEYTETDCGELNFPVEVLTASGNMAVIWIAVDICALCLCGYLQEWGLVAAVPRASKFLHSPAGPHCWSSWRCLSGFSSVQCISYLSIFCLHLAL